MVGRFTYLFSRRFWEHIGWRLTGPGHLRFIIQPIVAIALGIRDGLQDAKAGTPPYVYDLIRNPQNRERSFKAGWASIGKPVIIAIVIDVIIQYIVFDTVYLAAAVIVGTFIMGVPYSIARGITNRIATRRRAQARPVIRQRAA